MEKPTVKISHYEVCSAYCQCSKATTYVLSILMLTASAVQLLSPRPVQKHILHVRSCHSWRALLYRCVLQIYRERVHDLLANLLPDGHGPKPLGPQPVLNVRDDAKGRVIVDGLTEVGTCAAFLA